jgi:protein-S-isoprenylcysteine O-methyltransferase Ste14
MSVANALLIYFVAYFISAFVWRSWRTWRLTGVNPVVLPQSDDAYGYVARGFKLVMCALLFYLLTLCLLPQWVVSYSVSVTWLVKNEVVWSGWVLLLVALVATLKAQADMGAAWRVGIDSQRATKLVTHGLFSLGRNPIFLSMRTALVGLFLVLPNVVTLLFFAVSDVLMQVQVRLEETHLSQLHGSTYAQYRTRTRRWL